MYIKNNTATILIHEEITEENSKQIVDFIYGLEFLDDVENLEININSPGGNVMAGMNLFSAIKNSSKNTTITVEFLAASIATIVMFAGDSLTFHDYSNVMIHNPFASGSGNEKVLDTVKASIMTIYSDRFGKNVSKMMNKETWLNATDLEKLGIGDKIIYSREDQLVTEFQNDINSIMEVSNKLIKNKFFEMKNEQINEEIGNEIIENETEETVEETVEEVVENETETVEEVTNELDTKMSEMIETIERLETENKTLSEKLLVIENKETEELKMNILQNAAIKDSEFDKWMCLDLDTIKNLTATIVKNVETPQFQLVENKVDRKFSELSNEEKEHLKEHNYEEYEKLFFENK